MTNGTERPPAGTGASVPHERLVVAGVPILIEAGSAALAGRITDWMHRALALTVGPAKEQPLRIAMREQGPRPVLPDGSRVLAAIGDWQVLCDGDRVFTLYTHAQCTLHLAAGRATLWLAEGWWREPVKRQQPPWLSLLAWLLRERGRFALHASAVARDGLGLLCAGDSGSGKSSTALALIGAGWDWLADDVALFEPGPMPCLHGLARGFSFHPALAEHLPGLAGEPVEDKRFAPLDGRFPGRRVAACRPAAMLLPRVIGEDSSRLEAASPAEALLALMPASGFILAGGAVARRQAHMQALSDLTTAIPAYRLFAGRDIFGHGGALEALLDRHRIWGAR